MKKDQNIHTLLDDLDKAEENLVRLKASAEPLRAEAEKLIVELSASTDVSTLILGSDVPAKDESANLRLRKLESIRSKLELLPGVATQYEAQVRSLRHETYKAVDALVIAALQEAKISRDTLVRDETARAVRMCGGDAARVKRVIAVMLENCEVARWCRHLRNVRHQMGQNHNRDGYKQAIQEVKRFKDGQCCHRGA